MYENRTYAIVDGATFTAAVTSGGIDVETLFGKILETNLSTLRHTVCGDDKFVVKTDNQADVAYLTARAQEEGVLYELYNHADCLALMATTAWSLPLEF